jgi:hypothetical protein
MRWYHWLAVAVLLAIALIGEALRGEKQREAARRAWR